MNSIDDHISPIKAQLPTQVVQLIDKRDGPEQLVPLLLKTYDPSPKNQEQVWDFTALVYMAQGRLHEALSIYNAMYAKQIEMQLSLDLRIHKGTPLVRMSDLHRNLSNPVLAKRYMMMTLCEDAINYAGKIPAEGTGSYFRLVWQFGISPELFNKYATKIWALNLENATESRFPEWLLQELDEEWITEYPSSTEAAVWSGNRGYVKWLLNKLGSGDGRALERLAHYLLSTVPGFRAQMRVRSQSTDYDIVCAPEGLAYDFRSELGRYFLCECKDWSEPADVTAVVKFAGVLRSVKCKFGVLFSKNGISGKNETKNAERELLKIFQQDNLTIVVFDEAYLRSIAERDSFFSVLRKKYEQIRLDLPRGK